MEVRIADVVPLSLGSWPEKCGAAANRGGAHRRRRQQTIADSPGHMVPAKLLAVRRGATSAFGSGRSGLVSAGERKWRRRGRQQFEPLGHHLLQAPEVEIMDAGSFKFDDRVQ